MKWVIWRNGQYWRGFWVNSISEALVLDDELIKPFREVFRKNILRPKIFTVEEALVNEIMDS